MLKYMKISIKKDKVQFRLNSTGREDIEVDDTTLYKLELYLSFGSKVRPRTFGCLAMSSAVFFKF